MKAYVIGLFAVVVLIGVAGCPTVNDETDPGTNSGNNNDSGDTTNDNGDTTDTGTDGFGLSGRIAAPAGTKPRGRAQSADEGYTIVAQSNETGEIYRGATDATGAFEIDVPEEEKGNTFTVTIVNPDSTAEGPVVFGQSGDEAVTGVTLEEAAELGTIALPADASAAPIGPGSDANTDALADGDVTARVDENGVPVGVGSFGKGADAAGTASDDPNRPFDADADGLPDLFDADNDGDGLVDDFDADGGDAPPADGVRVNFFANLKIGPDKADTYYKGTETEIDTALAVDTIITFEVLLENPAATTTITAARLIDPMPPYMAGSDLMTDSGFGLVFTPWTDTKFEFEAAGDRFQAFVRPNAVVDAGATFNVEVEFGDGSKNLYSFMINYVFHNIPRLESYASGSATPEVFDGEQPIAITDGEDVTLEFRPPLDETGALLSSGLDYQFEFFYEDASGAQIQDIDVAVTWPTPPAGMDIQNTIFRVVGSDLTLSADETFSVVLPAEMFVDSVTHRDGTVVPVSGYKIDIAAQKGSNAAIMLRYEK